MKIKKDEYQDYLINVVGVSESTANTYINRLRYYYKNNKVLDNKSKNYINQTKNALKYLYKMNDIYYNSETVNLSKIHDRMKHKKPIRVKIKLSTVNKKINGMKDKRKKLAFRLQEVSGLRISEISNLGKDDIEFVNGKIYVSVIDGKGGKDRRVATIKDKWLYKELQNLEERNGKLFHKSST
ncbi:MAG: tyrosine-type recombinase/integrase, partial [Fusobacteriaceae bacterium]|nr:tyrosine-type recombinase/integrase [Fusobacteriaceae bacterium]